MISHSKYTNRAKRCFRNIYLFIIVLVFDIIETFIIVNKSINLLNAQIFLYKKRYIKFILMLYNLDIYIICVYILYFINCILLSIQY